MNKHTFAICAYKESPYLETCIKSLLDQTVKTDVIVATSTPNSFIGDLCKKYNLPLYINTGEHGITQDWNFAYSQTDADYITIAHQDDVYDKHYVEELYRAVSKVKKPIIFFTDYSELRDDRVVHDNKLLKIKRWMLIPLRFRSALAIISVLWLSPAVLPVSPASSALSSVSRLPRVRPGI